MFAILMILRWCALHEHSPDPSYGRRATPLAMFARYNGNPYAIVRPVGRAETWTLVCFERGLMRYVMATTGTVAPLLMARGRSRQDE